MYITTDDNGSANRKHIVFLGKDLLRLYKLRSYLLAQNFNLLGGKGLTFLQDFNHFIYFQTIFVSLLLILTDELIGDLLHFVYNYFWAFLYLA